MQKPLTPVAFLLVTALASPLGAQSDPSPGQMLARSEWGRLDIIEGRIRLVGCRGDQNAELTSHDPETGIREGLWINALDGSQPELKYEYADGHEVWTVTVKASGFANIARVVSGEGGSQVCYSQHAGGECKLLVTQNGRTREYAAADLWHLIVEHRRETRDHLLPMLDQLRSDWLLASQSKHIERQLVELANRPDFPSSRHLQVLVEQLRHPEFAERRNAARELRALGHIAVGHIMSLDLSELDAEQRSRLRRIRQEFQTSDRDTPKRIAAWLAGDVRVWCAMLDHDRAETRAVAARHLATLTGHRFEFDPLASHDERQQQLRYLRLQLAIDGPLVAAPTTDRARLR